MTRSSPFSACLLAMDMGFIPEEPEGMAVVRDALDPKWKNGGEKVHDTKRDAERFSQYVSHHKMLVKLEKL